MLVGRTIVLLTDEKHGHDDNYGDQRKHGQCVRTAVFVHFDVVDLIVRRRFVIAHTGIPIKVLK